MLTITLNVGQNQIVNAQAVDANLDPGLLLAGAVPVWSGTGLVISTAIDGLSASISGTNPGSYVVTVASQAPNSATITGSFNVIINEQGATQFVFTAGAVS